MTAKKGHIYIGHFNNFKGEDSILISVDIEGLLELENVFLKLSNGQTEFDLSNLNLLDKNFCLKINAFEDKENIGLIKTKSDSYEWRNTRQKWGEFREKLTGMYKNGNGGHHYLDSNSTENKDLQVICSWNEYPLTFWEEHKNKNAL